MKLSSLLRRSVREPTISELMCPNPTSCVASDALSDVAKMMWDYDCGAVPVVADDQQVIGVITDRDICMAAYTQGKALSEIAVRVAMSSPAVCCAIDEEFCRVHELMQVHQVRRLFVTDSNSRLLGTLSLGDLARHSEKSHARGLNHFRINVARTLAAVSRSREPTSSVEPIIERESH